MSSFTCQQLWPHDQLWEGKEGGIRPPDEFLIMIDELLYYYEHSLMAIQLNIYLIVYLEQLAFFLSYGFLHCIFPSTAWSS